MTTETAEKPITETQALTTTVDGKALKDAITLAKFKAIHPRDGGEWRDPSPGGPYAFIAPGVHLDIPRSYPATLRGRPVVIQVKHNFVAPVGHSGSWFVACCVCSRVYIGIKGKLRLRRLPDRVESKNE